MKLNLTNKKGQPLKIDQTQLLAALKFGLIVLVGAFSLFASKTTVSKVIYQQRVISADHKAVHQLTTNISAANTLTSQYAALFENSNALNAIGGKNDKSSNAVPPDVDNARLALDALPTTYDYPALIASITKIMNNDGISSSNVSGTDQTTAISNAPSSKPAPITITLAISGTGTYQSVQAVFKDMERSIRPFDVTTLQISGTGSKLSFNANVNTYFQPAKMLGITNEKIR